MCKQLDAIHGRRDAADKLRRACAAAAGPLRSRFASVLAEPIPDDMRALVAEAERRLKQ